MREKAYRALIDMGYSPDEARETVEAASEADLAALVPAEKIIQIKPKSVRKAKSKTEPVKKVEPVKEFDPVAEAMGIVKKVEERPTIRYMIRPLYKLKLVDEVDEATFKGISEEMSAMGGHWDDIFKCFVFESNPEDKM